MRPFVICLAFFGTVLPFLMLHADGVLEGYSPKRYETLWKKSPFTLSSVSIEENHGFAQNYALVAIAKIGSSDLVTLVDKKSQERITLSDQPNQQGIKLVSVGSNPDPQKATVKIQKGEEVAEVRFDPSLLAAHPANAAEPSSAFPNTPAPFNLPQQPPIPTPSGIRPLQRNPSPTNQPPPPIAGIIKRRIVVPPPTP